MLEFNTLNFNSKIPNIHCIIISTADEYKEIKSRISKKVSVLAFNKNDKFTEFIIKILASYRVGYKDNYLDLTFSIDPGAKHIGLVIFLDDYFLNSYTIDEKGELIKIINEHVDALQENNAKVISLNFKLGRWF